MAAPLLLVDDVHTYYGDSYILQGVSLSVAQGSITVVLGRNGVGKTTLLRSIMAFTPPRRGRILFRDMDLARLPSHRIAQAGISLVPQGRRIFPSLTVSENLSLASRPAPAGESGWSIAAVLDTFPRLGERINSRAGTLSGGEQQMLAVGRALVSNARFILMDEPTEGLSPFLIEELKRLALRLRDSGHTILLVEQNLGFALGVGDTVYVMDKGRIAVTATAAALAEDEATKQQYLGA